MLALPLPIASRVQATLETERRVRLRTLDAVPASDERSSEFVLHRRLSMHQPDRPEPRRLLLHSTEPGNHLGTIRVGTITVDYLYVRMERDIVSEYVKHRLTLDNSTAKSVLRLKTHD